MSERQMGDLVTGVCERWPRKYPQTVGGRANPELARFAVKCRDLRLGDDQIVAALDAERYEPTPKTETLAAVYRRLRDAARQGAGPSPRPAGDSFSAAPADGWAPPAAESRRKLGLPPGATDLEAAGRLFGWSWSEHVAWAEAHRPGGEFEALAFLRRQHECRARRWLAEYGATAAQIDRWCAEVYRWRGEPVPRGARGELLRDGRTDRKLGAAATHARREAVAELAAAAESGGDR